MPIQSSSDAPAFADLCFLAVTVDLGCGAAAVAGFATGGFAVAASALPWYTDGYTARHVPRVPTAPVRAPTTLHFTAVDALLTPLIVHSCHDVTATSQREPQRSHNEQDTRTHRHSYMETAMADMHTQWYSRRTSTSPAESMVASWEVEDTQATLRTR